MAVYLSNIFIETVFQRTIVRNILEKISEMYENKKGPWWPRG